MIAHSHFQHSACGGLVCLLQTPDARARIKNTVNKQLSMGFSLIGQNPKEASRGSYSSQALALKS